MRRAVKRKARSGKPAFGHGHSLKHIEQVEWSPAQWAKRRNYSRAFVYNLLRDGKLGNYVVNGRMRITREHEIAFLAANGASPTSMSPAEIETLVARRIKQRQAGA